MKKFALILLMVAVIVLSSCASQNPTIVGNHKAADGEDGFAEPVEEKIDIPSREAVFIYGNQCNSPKRLVLNLGSEPVLLPSGYVRLVGVVSGGKPVALIEIGGRGLALGVGEMVDGYIVGRIDGNGIMLERGQLK